MSDWSMNLKVGDEVCIVLDYGTKSVIEKVTGLTPAQLIVAGSRRFWRKNGEPVGASTGRGYEAPVLVALTEERRREANYQSAKRYLNTSPWMKLSKEDTIALAAFTKTLVLAQEDARDANRG